MLLVGGFVALLGLLMAAGGGWLVAVGGSWYYLIAGVGMAVSGVLLASGRRAGAWLYALVFIGTFGWTAWESGLDYWRWVPRFDVVLALGILVAVTSTRLRDGFSRGAAVGTTAALIVVFAICGALAFAPHGVAHPGQVPAPQSASLSADTGDAQVADRPADGDWAAYGRSNAAARFSPLEQITPDNVGQLEQAFVYRTGDKLDKRWGAETTPLKVGDSVYMCTSRNIIISLDAASGKENWRYDPKVSKDAIPYTAACRGVTYYQVPKNRLGELESGQASQTAGNTPSDNGRSDNTAPASAVKVAAGTAGSEQAGNGSGAPSCSTRIVSPTLDGRLIAVDARTGKPCAGFGDNGEVDIKKNMGDTPDGYVSINSPPVIVDDVLVTGHQVLDGQKRYAPSGVIKGFDAVTGQLNWAWDAGRPKQSDPLTGDKTYVRGSPNMWTTAVGDNKLGLIYLPMANSAGDYVSASRTPAMNKWASSLVALDVKTGLPKWHFQTAHKDVWDYDPGSQPTLIDFPSGDGKVPAVVMPTKQGGIYVFDRRNGKPLGGGTEERPVPQGGVEPKQRSKTQPYSLYHTLRQPELTARDMWGLTPFDQIYCRIQFANASYKGMYTPPTVDRHFVAYTGYNGGSDWGSVAIDPSRGVLIANYNDMPNYDTLVPRAKADRLGWKPRGEGADKGGAEGAGDPQAGTPYAIDVNAGWKVPFTGMLCKEPPYGHIRAVDIASGKTLWDRPLGTARANGPFGIRSGLPVNIGTPNNGGSAVTAGGLIFIAAATDDLIRAIDIETGDTVWQAALPAGGQANPLVYEAGGREYLMIVATGHHFMETPSGDYVIAYALPK